MIRLAASQIATPQTADQHRPAGTPEPVGDPAAGASPRG
ncbi:hypothetical protein F4556_004442 [Kitasatospora gansuensis]|uniref:Uncharacterized protein n=1 Tax=Kitasatospora gansuensis TaxID=258050 RepID=A0A7W7SF32_9ACTN|nr:hypothetical protein [Kitasatospora gansuensis]